MALKPGDRQMSMIIPNVEELVAAEHSYRAKRILFDWTELTKPLRSCYSKTRMLSLACLECLLKEYSPRCQEGLALVEKLKCISKH